MSATVNVTTILLDFLYNLPQIFMCATVNVKTMLLDVSYLCINNYHLSS